MSHSYKRHEAKRELLIGCLRVLILEDCASRMRNSELTDPVEVANTICDSLAEQVESLRGRVVSDMYLDSFTGSGDDPDDLNALPTLEEVERAIEVAQDELIAIAADRGFGPVVGFGS